MNTTTNKDYNLISLKTSGQDDAFLGEKRVPDRVWSLSKQFFGLAEVTCPQGVPAADFFFPGF